MAALGRLVAELALDSAQFTEGLKRAQKGFDDFERSLGRAATGALTSFAGQLIALETASKVADAAISAFTETVKGLAALDDAAEKTGATVESLAKLQAQAVVSGQAFESIEGALIKLNKGLLNADDETKSAGAALEALGIQARDANGELKDSGELVFEVSKKFSEFSDKGPGKAALAMDLFGKTGAQLLPLLKDLADSGDINVKVTEAQAQAADDYEKNIKRLAAQKLELKRIIVSEVLPAANEFLTAILDLKKNGEGLAATIKQLSDDGSIAKWAREGAIAIGQLIDQSVQGVNQFKALAKDLEGIAYGARAVNAAISSGVARTAGAMATSLELTAKSQAFFEKSSAAFGESERIAALRVTTYTNAISAQTGAFDDARDRALKLAASTDTVAKATLKYAGAARTGKDEAAEFAKTLESLINKIQGKDAGVDSDFAKNLETLDKALEIGKISLGQYNQLLSSYIVSQKVVVDAEKKRVDALEALDKITEHLLKLNLEQIAADSKTIAAAADVTRAYEEENRKLTESIEQMGLSAIQINNLNIAKLRAKLVTYELAAATGALEDADAKAAKEIEAQIDLLEKRNGIFAQREEIDRYANSLQGLSGFFEDLFLNGKKAFDNLGQTVKRFFAQLASQMAAKYVLNIGASLLNGNGLNLGSLFGGNSGGGFSIGSILGGASRDDGVGGVIGGTGILGAIESVPGIGPSIAAFLDQFKKFIPVIGAIVALAGSLFKNETGIKIDNSVRDGRGRKDIIDSALGQFDVSGDIGNEAFKPLIDRVNQLDSFIADNLLSPEALAVVKENIQRISSDMTDWFGFDDEASAKIAIEKSSKLFLQQRYSVAFDALEAGAGDLIRSFEGTADELLAYIAKLSTSAYAIGKLNDAVPGLNLTIAAFSKLTDKAQEAFTALALSIDAFNTDTNQTVTDILDAASRGVVTSYQRQADAVLLLRDGLADGSVSIEDFAAGIGNLATAYAQATAKIADTKRALEELFTNSQKGFLLQSMSVDEKYAYYQQQAEALYAQLANATDPEVIDRLARRIDSLQNAAFGLLSPEQQAALSGEFISGSQRVEDLVNARLAAAGDLLDKNNANLRDVIRDALAEFAAKINDVADKDAETADINRVTANTPRRLDIVVYKNGDVEVGQV